jgi:pimeloyl-ACP methyl ester carboxylesterase
LYVDVIGSGPRLVLLHGSVTPGWSTWGAQRPLADRFTLVVPTRSGYPPNPPLERIDFEQQAGELAAIVEPGDHLAAHSYGAVVALVAAPRLPLASLTVVEPPAFAVARGHPAVQAFGEAVARAPQDPRGYLEYFMPLVGSTMPVPDPLPASLEAGAWAALSERWPSEAEPALADIAAAPYRKLVVSGGHSAAFDAVCDVLEERLGAERAVLPGAGHAVPRLGAPFNDVLESFLTRS